jgi:hypothetical protein
MTLTRSLPNQNPGGISAADHRRILAGEVARNADGTARVGVLPAHANTLVTGRGGGDMAYDVAPFVAVLARSNTGAELVANDALTRVPTTPAPNANSRIDVIWVRSLFPLAGDTPTDPVFGVTQGDPAGVPLKPSIPAGAFEFATAVVLSSTTQTSTVVITPTHQFTAMAGAPVLMRSRAELEAWAAPVGATARTLDTDLEWVRRPAPTSGNPLTWYVAPGQRLAYMAGSTTSGVANTIMGSVIRTLALPIGQRVRVRCGRIGMYNTAAGGASYDVRLRNNAADVSSSANDKAVPGRAYQPGGSQVVSVPGVDTEFVTTVAAPVSAALFVTGGISFGGDGQELWIEAL